MAPGLLKFHRPVPTPIAKMMLAKATLAKTVRNGQHDEHPITLRQ